MAPLIQFTRKDQPFSSKVEANNAFQSLKVSFTITSFLIHAYSSKPFVLEIDASEFAIGDVLLQLGKYNLFHRVGFCSHIFSLAEINYEIHDEKLLTIVDAFEEWHYLLEGVQHEITMYLNCKNLQYFMTTHVLNQCQAHWALFLFRI